MGNETQCGSNDVSYIQQLDSYTNNSVQLILHWYTLFLTWKDKKHLIQLFESKKIIADHEILYNPETGEYELYTLDLNIILWVEKKTSGTTRDILWLQKNT